MKKDDDKVEDGDRRAVCLDPRRCQLNELKERKKEGDADRRVLTETKSDIMIDAIPAQFGCAASVAKSDACGEWQTTWV